MKSEQEKMEAKPLTIGLPRALLYFRYKVLWKVFFRELGVNTIVSRHTTKGVLEDGIAHSIDETCLSTKIYMGHVHALIGHCDYILVPRISNFGRGHYMCTKFESLYDMTVNTFRNSRQKFIAYNVDAMQKLDEEKAFILLGESLGFKKRETLKAYKTAKKVEAEQFKKLEKEQEKRFESPKLKILLAGHSYLTQDDYIGKPIIRMLESMGAEVLMADVTDRKMAMEQSLKVSPTLKWEMNREITGSIYKNHDRVDGIILMTAFPCGPDSMVNEIIIRQNYQTPILTLLLDAQDGAAGIETRLESFLDIIRFKEGKL